MLPSEFAIIIEKLSDARQRLCLVTLIAEIMSDVIRQSRKDVIEMIRDGDDATAEEFFDLLESSFSNIRSVATCLNTTAAEDFDADAFFRGVTTKYGTRNAREDLH